MITFSNDKCCVCPRDIEIYLSAVFFYLAAALPQNTWYTVIREVWESTETQINDIKNTIKRKTAKEDYTNNIKVKIKTAATLFIYLSTISFL